MSRKKKSLENLTEITGKEQTSYPTTLDGIWGGSGMTKFQDLSEEEFTEKINDMNVPELRSYAHDLGIIISQETSRLKAEILKEYRTHKLSLSIPNISLGQSEIKLDKQAEAILREGR